MCAGVTAALAAVARPKANAALNKMIVLVMSVFLEFKAEPD
jgi:hypothetical protein